MIVVVRFVCYQTEIVKETENTTEQQRSMLPKVAQQEQISSVDLLTYPDDISSSNERVINHSNTSGIYSNDSVNRLSSTGPCSSQDIASGGASGEQNEDGDCGPWRQVSREIILASFCISV